MTDNWYGKVEIDCVVDVYMAKQLAKKRTGMRTSRRKSIERLPDQISGRGAIINGSKVCGLALYVVDELIGTGLYGATRDEVFTEIGREGIRHNFREYMEITGGSQEDARKKRYWPAEFKVEDQEE